MNKLLGIAALGSVVYLGWSKLCENAGVREPVAYVAAKVADAAFALGKAAGKKCVELTTEAAAKMQENMQKARENKEKPEDPGTDIATANE